MPVVRRPGRRHGLDLPLIALAGRADDASLYLHDGSTGATDPLDRELTRAVPRPSPEPSNPVPFQDVVEQLVATVRVVVPQGVLVEIDHFLPEGWTSSVDGDWHVVVGPEGREWTSSVRRLCHVLAYAEGSLLRRASPQRWELYTWRDADGTGFRVAFLARPVDEPGGDE